MHKHLLKRNEVNLQAIKTHSELEVQSIKGRLNSVEKLLDFEIGAIFRHLHG